jgi:transaldolase
MQEWQGEIMTNIKSGSRLAEKVFQFLRHDFKPHFWELEETFPSNPIWKSLAELGSELWLDSGDLEHIETYWTQEFCALTTNNTLLNKEVKKGIYDDFIIEADKLLSEFPDLTERERRLELAFMLNARHGLKLVEKYDAYVSVEEHTDLAFDVDAAIEYARRYHEICPERFIVKIPFTPAGLLATRKLSDEGIAINHTLGFSARQNYLIARIAQPEYVNVFMGRLNSFVIDNNLGNGDLVGEKTTLASQAMIRQMRKTYDLPCRQIGASFRSAQQVRNLAGLDVMTIPLQVAEDFLKLQLSPSQITSKMHMEYQPQFNPEIDLAAIRFDTLWTIESALVETSEMLEQENLDHFTPDDLVNFFAEHDLGDLLVGWTDQERSISMAEGKIPKLENWRDALAQRRIGLDSLMNLAGLNSFAADQKEMDQHVLEVLEHAKVAGHM